MAQWGSRMCSVTGWGVADHFASAGVDGGGEKEVRHENCKGILMWLSV